MEKGIIDKLVEEHKILLGILDDVVGLSLEKEPQVSKIVSKLDEFKKISVNHIYKENKYVFQKFFENTAHDSIAASSAKLLLNEMVSIRKGVFEFLNEYKEEEKIRSDFDNFKERLDSINEVLRLRMRIEEEGWFEVYK